MTTSRADYVEERFIEREHAGLRAGLAVIREAIDDAHRLGRPELADRVARSIRWLRRELLPHAAWEEAWLYPQLDRGGGTPWTTRGLRTQHEQIRELATALETASQVAHEHWSSEVAFRVVAALARLDALISAHMTEEEWTVFPLLEQPLVAQPAPAPAEDPGDAARPA